MLLRRPAAWDGRLCRSLVLSTTRPLLRDWGWQEVSPKNCSKLLHVVARHPVFGAGLGAFLEHVQTEAERSRPNSRHVYEGWVQGLHTGIIAQPFAHVKWCVVGGQVGSTKLVRVSRRNSSVLVRNAGIVLSCCHSEEPGDEESKTSAHRPGRRGRHCPNCRP